MNPWLEALAVSLLAASGVLLGRWFSRLPRPYWTIGYFIPLLLIAVYAVATRRPSLTLVPPVSWMMMGRNKFAAIGFITTMVLTTPLSRLPRKRDRMVVTLLMGLIVVVLSVWPFLAPAFNRNYLANLKTNMDDDGVCRQSTDYNCGPAAAVTALRQLDLPAEEGEIAILALELQRRYGKDGLVCEYRVFKDVNELKSAGLTLAVIKFSFMLDHYVVVLEATDDCVIVGDPLKGKMTLTRNEFKEKWRFVGVVLRRTSF